MTAELTLVANAGEAHLFIRESRHDPLTPIALLTHPQSRTREAALGDDRPGHGSSDDRPGGVAFMPRMSHKRKEHLRFADEIAKRIDEELASGRCGSLVLVASCPFIGELKGRLSLAAKRSLSAQIEHDLTFCPVGELERRLGDALHPTPH